MQLVTFYMKHFVMILSRYSLVCSVFNNKIFWVKLKESFDELKKKIIRRWRLWLVIIYIHDSRWCSHSIAICRWFWTFDWKPKIGFDCENTSFILRQKFIFFWLQSVSNSNSNLIKIRLLRFQLHVFFLIVFSFIGHSFPGKSVCCCKSLLKMGHSW